MEPLNFHDPNIHLWFELSYAQYLTIPSETIRAMPQEWQWRLTQCIAVLDLKVDWRPQHGQYVVAPWSFTELWDDFEGEWYEGWGEPLGPAIDCLTIPRSVLQSMPASWDRAFTELLYQLDATLDWRPKDGNWRVRLMDGDVELDDPLMDYFRGRRKVSFRPKHASEAP